jgi:hypothetical protein
MALHRMHAPDTDTVIQGHTFVFSPEGHTVIELVDLLTNQRERREIVAPIDDNWEQFPSFGHYENVIRIERDLAGLSDAGPEPI